MQIPEAHIIAEAESVWGLNLQAAGCPICRQAHLVQAKNLGKRCPHCAKGQLEAQPARMRPEAPEMVLPFRKQPGELKTLLEAFVKPVRLRPPDLDAATLAGRAAPIYLPMWLVDANLKGQWQAEMGFDYQVKSSQDSFRSGNWHSQDVIETRIRWEGRLGEIQRAYQNVAVPALSDWKRLRSLVGGFSLEQAAPYDPGLLGAAGQGGAASLRVPDLPPESAWPTAQSALDQSAAQECQQAAQAQHLRNYAIQCAYENLHWTQLLQPIYATFYHDDDGQPQMLLINGQTGQIGGKRLASQKKGLFWGALGLGLAALLFVLGVILIGLSTWEEILGPIGIVPILLSLIAGFVGLMLMIWPWQWNRKQRST